MSAYATQTIFPTGRASYEYIITAKSLDEARRAAEALSKIHGVTVRVLGA